MDTPKSPDRLIRGFFWSFFRHRGQERRDIVKKGFPNREVERAHARLLMKMIVYYPKRNKGKREPSEAEQQAERILEKLRELERETQQRPTDTGIKKS